MANDELPESRELMTAEGSGLTFISRVNVEMTLQAFMGLHGAHAASVIASYVQVSGKDKDTGKLLAVFQFLNTLSRASLEEGPVHRDGDQYYHLVGETLVLSDKLGSDEKVEIRFEKVSDTLYINPDYDDRVPNELMLQIVVVHP